MTKKEESGMTENKKRMTEEKRRLGITKGDELGKSLLINFEAFISAKTKGEGRIPSPFSSVNR